MSKYIAETLITESEIQAMVEKLGAQINRDYQGKNVVIIGVLRGSVVFMADLIRQLNLPVEIDFISVSSYQGTKSTGVVKIVKDTDHDVTGKHVILVEDIVDTGLTLKYLRELFSDRKPASLRVCSAFDKPSCRKVEVEVEYIGQAIPNAFVVGYGLDYQQLYRNLPYLAVLGEDGKEDQDE
ncbi:MAG: hypoxanthine phosphoribosyltransferase [Eubacteriales bacterium]|nr:hypoxanthine phosphoribosyltransferase [Eubacteriales bacterium]